MLGRLRHGRHHFLFRNGFPVAARLAWGACVPGDPPLATWLGDETLHGEEGNGIVHFAPKLMQRALAEPQPAPLDRLKVILRWRHAANAGSQRLWAQTVAGLQEGAGRITIASDWSRLEAGACTPAHAHLSHLAAALAPWDEAGVRRHLMAAGWEPRGPHWRLRTPDRPGTGLVLSVGPRLLDLELPPGDVFPQAGGLHHLSGPPLALVVARHITQAGGAAHAAQVLDRLVDLLPDADNIARFEAYGKQHGYRNLSDKALSLLGDLLRTRFRGAGALGESGRR